MTQRVATIGLAAAVLFAGCNGGSPVVITLCEALAAEPVDGTGDEEVDATVAEVLTAPLYAISLGYDVIGYLHPPLSDAIAREFADEVASRDDVVRVVAVAHAEALEEFTALFSGDLDIDSVAARDLPTSVRVVATTADAADDIEQELGRSDQMLQVVRNTKMITALERRLGLVSATARARWVDAVELSGHASTSDSAVAEATDELTTFGAGLIRTWGNGRPDRVVGPGELVQPEEWGGLVAAAKIVAEYAETTCGLDLGAFGAQ